MDPNATLAEIRQLVDKVYAARDNGGMDGNDEEYDALQALAENFRNLDEWLTRGGFAPHAWRLLDVQWRDHDLGPDEARTIPDPLGPPDPAGAHLPEHDDA